MTEIYLGRDPSINKFLNRYTPPSDSQIEHQLPTELTTYSTSDWIIDISGMPANKQYTLRDNKIYHHNGRNDNTWYVLLDFTSTDVMPDSGFDKYQLTDDDNSYLLPSEIVPGSSLTLTIEDPWSEAEADDDDEKEYIKARLYRDSITITITKK